MITKNYKLYCYARCVGANTSGIVNALGENITYYPQNTGGQANRGDFGISIGTVYVGSIAQTSEAGIRFGRGSTPPMENDYALEDLITSGLTASASKVIAPDGSYAEGAYVLMNTSDADITINEIGYFGKVAESSSSNRGHCVLMERTVLSEPITLPPGGTASISYRVDLYNW